MESIKKTAVESGQIDWIFFDIWKVWRYQRGNQKP